MGTQQKGGVFSIISDKLTMTLLSKCRKFRAEGTWPWRALPCLVLGSTYRTPPRVSPSQKIYRKPRSFGAAAISNIGLVRAVGERAFDTVVLRASCMTWATWFPHGLATSICCTRGTDALRARRSSTRTCPTIPCRRPITLTASFPWPCDSSSKMVCPIKPPVGTCGAIIGFLSPSPPSKTGWRPGGKKGGQANVDELS